MPQFVFSKHGMDLDRSTFGELLQANSTQHERRHTQDFPALRKQIADTLPTSHPSIGALCRAPHPRDNIFHQIDNGQA
jgi:hypothetical protein